MAGSMMGRTIGCMGGAQWEAHGGGLKGGTHSGVWGSALQCSSLVAQLATCPAQGPQLMGLRGGSHQLRAQGRGWRVLCSPGVWSTSVPLPCRQPQAGPRSRRQASGPALRCPSPSPRCSQTGPDQTGRRPPSAPGHACMGVGMVHGRPAVLQHRGATP